ncbi:MAG: NADH-quinone oxidoreductase subunit NuoG [Nitrospirota bacterium]
MAEKVRLNFNGQDIEVEKGTLLIEAAKVAGAELPHFCYHPKLKADANCRMCIVEVLKMPKLQTSCSTVAAEGMVVRSDTDRVKDAQNGVMAFILGNHPLDCPECDQGGECQLQDFAHRHSPSVGSFTEEKRVFEKEYFGPLIEKEMNRCVSCLRCVRYCDEVIDSNALGSIDRGSVTEIGGFAHHPLDCEFCGGCIQICPVGALTSRASMYDYRTWQVKKTNTICTYCGDGCQLTLETIDDKVIRVSSEMGIGRNGGDICARGFFGYDFVNHNDRLLRPQVVKQGKRMDVTWEWALNQAASSLKAIQEKNGASAIAGIISSHCTNEDAYLFQKLMREVIGTPHVDSGARYGYMNSARAFSSAFGTMRMVRYEDIVNADVILSFAGDMTETNPICAIKVKEAVRKKGARLIAIDSFNSARDTYKSHLPHLAERHLSVRIGTEGWVIIGLLKVLSEKKSAEAIDKTVSSVSFETIEKNSGIGEAAIREAAALYAGASRGVLIIGRAILRSENGYQNSLNLADLAILAGQVDKAGAGILALAEENNELGVVEMGAAAEYLPGFVPAAVGGKTLVEIIDAILQGEIKALYIVGENPLRSLPQKKVKEAFEKLDLLICQDLFLTETAAMADIVFSASSFAEKDGRYINQEGEVQRVRKAVDPVGVSKPDWMIFSLLAEKLGTAFSFKSADEIWKTAVLETSKSSPNISTAVSSYLKSGRSPIVPSESKVASDGFFDIQIGQSLYHSGRLSTYASGLNVIVEKESVSIHPEDAELLMLTDGEIVHLTAEGKAIEVKISFSKRLSKGTLFFPEHFSLEIKGSFPLTLDPETHVPYADRGVVSLSKIPMNDQAK